MGDKLFKTYDEQIDLLKSKPIIIEDENYAKNILKDISYFALINGYKNVFKVQDKYNNVYFEDILSLFRFDEKLRELLLKNILIIERKLKSSLTYYFSEKYPNCQEDYLNVNNYNYDKKNNREHIIKLVLSLKSITNSSKYEYITHYTKNYNNKIPLWVLINAVSFGKASKMYSLSQQSIQQKVANDFGIVTNAELKNMLELLTYFRNVCAHNERLYNYKTRISLKKSKLYTSFNLDKNESCNLYSVVITFKYLLKKQEFTNFYDELTNIINGLEFRDGNTTQKTILNSMGFKDEWYKINGINVNELIIKTTLQDIN